MILRPNRVHYLNQTATEMLDALYGQRSVDVAAVVAQAAQRYAVPEAQVEQDLDALLQSLSQVLKDQTGCAPAVKCTTFGSHPRTLPVLSEIALTYRCQNRCFFCYASAPDRGRSVPEMTTAQVQAVLDKIVDQAQVPTVSFTGGEPTLRADLPELIAYARGRGLRANLITNGLRCADDGLRGEPGSSRAELGPGQPGGGRRRDARCGRGQPGRLRAHAGRACATSRRPASTRTPTRPSTRATWPRCRG